MRKILLWRKMIYHSNVVLHTLAAERRQFIAAIANSYSITIYNIVHCNTFMLRNMFWQKFGRFPGPSQALADVSMVCKQAAGACRPMLQFPFIAIVFVSSCMSSFF